MDRALYIAMSGAKQNTLGQSAHANNLANVNTTGFRSDYTQSRAQGVFGEFFPTRAFAMSERPASDFRQGPLIETGRSMDVVVEGDGWFAVQAPDGSEAYTRAGDLSVAPDGRLLNGAGLPMLGDAGPIVLPPFDNIEISRTGLITIQPSGETPAAVVEPVQLKLVRPNVRDLEKGQDGLFRFRDNAQQVAVADPNVTLSRGFLEGSNVNAVSELTNMIALNRQYEMQVKLMKSVDENTAATTQILANQ